MRNYKQPICLTFLLLVHCVFLCARIPVIFALILGLYRVFFHLRIKNFAEIICHTINFSNFVFGDHSDFCLYFFVFQHYKVTTNFANHQIYKHL